MSARTLVNIITLSRIPLAMLFIFLFQANIEMLKLAGLVFLTAFLTDITDGFLARKLKVASMNGRHWDSLGDKAIYIAAIVSFNTCGMLGPIISWGLLLREVMLYVSRIIYSHKMDKLELTRPYTKLHGYLMYVTIFLGFANMMTYIQNQQYEYMLILNMSAIATLVVGVYSVWKFVVLK